VQGGSAGGEGSRTLGSPALSHPTWLLTASASIPLMVDAGRYPAMPCSLLACMALFFTADTHFGDPSILRRRVWTTSVDDHDEVLIAHWNGTVGPEDEIWHLGDFAAGARPGTLSRNLREPEGHQAADPGQSRHQPRAEPALG
jgi:hypothetical protein